MPATPERACHGKEGFTSKKAARGVVTTMRTRHGGKWSAYKCFFCSDWHVGHVSRNAAYRKDRGRRAYGENYG